MTGKALQPKLCTRKGRSALTRALTTATTSSAIGLGIEFGIILKNGLISDCPEDNCNEAEDGSSENK